MFLVALAIVLLSSATIVRAGGYDNSDSESSRSRGRGRGRGRGPKRRCGEHDVCEETPLITPHELANMLGGDDAPVVLDVYWGDKTASGPNPMFPDAKCTSKTASTGANRVSYVEAHVQGAYPIDWRCDLSTANFLYDMPVKDQFEKLVDELDIEDLDAPLVFYDRNPGANRFAIRGAFVFEYYGYNNIMIVDGGLEKILADDVGITIASGAGPAVPDPGATGSDARVRERHELLTDAEFIAENLDTEFVQLIDARPIHHYVGFNYPAMGAKDSMGMPLPDYAQTSGGAIHTGIPNVRNGHIPGCYNRAWADNYDWWTIDANDVAGASGAGFTAGEQLQFVTVKSATELASFYSKFLDTQKTVVTICNEGIHAALDRFMLEKVLCRGALVYEGSHTEWTALPFDASEAARSTAVVTGCEYGGSECPTQRSLASLSERSDYNP